MKQNKNFFDGLDSGWGDAISTTYEETSGYKTLFIMKVIDKNFIFSIKTREYKKLLNATFNPFINVDKIGKNVRLTFSVNYKYYKEYNQNVEENPFFDVEDLYISLNLVNNNINKKLRSSIFIGFTANVKDSDDYDHSREYVRGYLDPNDYIKNDYTIFDRNELHIIYLDPDFTKKIIDETISYYNTQRQVDEDDPYNLLNLDINEINAVNNSLIELNDKLNTENQELVLY